MKRFLYLTLILLLATMSVSTVQANDYLEQQEHYTVMNMGNGVFRFYVPIWVYGKVNNYYLDSYNALNNSGDSYLWYSLKPNAKQGSEDVHRIATVAAKRAGKNVDDDYNGVGEGYIYVHAGNVVIQNIKGGEALAIAAGDSTYWDKWTNSIKLKRKNDDDHKNITYLLIDWYVPQELAGKDFYWGVSAHIYKYWPNGSYMNKWWSMDEKLNVSDPQSPELFTPYLYALDEDGVTGFGNAAVQYVTYQSPVSYHTSLNATEMQASDNSGAIIVPTKDSVQRFFSATFQVNMSNDADKPQIYTLKTNTVHIPAYHRIYDFRTEEILDEQKSVTGQVKLSWGIRCPGAADLVEGDMFQVERALMPDFSDAQTIAVESFFPDSASYEIEDDPTAVLLEGSEGTEIAKLVSERGTFTVIDEAEDMKIEYEAVLTSRHVYQPGTPVYYRVRRASSAVWGWIDGFSMTDTLTKNSYLASLNPTQADYTLDPDYEKNRKVHFQVQIDNKPINIKPDAESECEFTYSVKEVSGFIPLRLRIRGLDGINPANYRYKLYYMPPEGTFKQEYIPLKDNVFEVYVESGSMVQVGVIGKDGYSAYTLNLIGELDDKAAYIADWELYSAGDGHNLYAHLNPDVEAMEKAKAQAVVDHPLPDSVRHILYKQLEQTVADISQSGARCNWDRNAMLYLQRISVETGDTIEFLIPSDSIKRQEDGSWTAHMTNVADQACTHYRYALRIDQTASVLKVLSPSDLNPVAVNGPEIYYNEVADIASFEASQGTDRYGIILTWEPTAGGLDYYTLSRREAGSTADFEPLKKTTDTGYRDNDVEPGKEYEYQIIASYTCNDSTSMRADTTVGFRSPYGLISGRIHYSDGTGCPGVKVAVTGEGLPVTGLTTLTDGSGRYAFDSLLYGAGKQYSIIPTSTYAEFRFNNTSMTTASVTLDATNPVAESIEFDNISSVRFTGRVLYSKSTIPVRDANLLLDSAMIYTSGGPLKTDASGNFEIQVPKNHPFTLQAVKEGHTFEGSGFVRMNNDSNLVLDKALDGVRIWDATKVRLAGRLVGGKIQAAQPLGFGLSTNNLGDDLQLVLELEGDNISQIVRDPDDLTRETFDYTVPHVVKIMSGGIDTTGTSQVHYQKKRIIINPDPKTGEYCADIFPVRYKVTQATAKGYSTLFAEGKTSEVIDLSNAPTRHTGEMLGDRVAQWNEKYSVTYRSPIDITCVQVRYGLVQPFMGEKNLSRQNVLNEMVEIPLAEKDSNGVYQYTFGAPVFNTGKYSFRISAHEDYYYNNDPTNQHEQVSINGGALKVYNGLHASEEMQTLSTLFPKWEQATQRVLGLSTIFDEDGQIDITIPVDNVSFSKTGEQALRVLDVSVESDGRYVEKQAVKAYIMGSRSKGNDYMTKLGGSIELLDVLRDPPGAKSYAFLESGTSFNYTYSWNVKLDFGVKFNWEYGTKKNLFFGTYIGSGPGTPAPFSGFPYSASFTNTIELPITSGFTWKNGGSYTFTTNERIETASDNWFVGSRGDIYIGVAQGVLLQMMDAVKPIDSLSYSTMTASTTENVGNTGSHTTVAEGYALDGQKYYLAIGEEMGASSTIDGTFAYSQDYILTVLVPQLLKERDALLVTGDSSTVQAIADAQRHEVYWSQVLPTDTTFAYENYRKIIPSGTTDSMWINIDRVAEYNETIAKWLDLIVKNEYEKITVMDGVNADLVGNYSVSNGVKLSHTESYDAARTWSWKWNGIAGSGSVNVEKILLSNAAEALGQKLARAMLIFLRRYRDHKNEGEAGKQSPFRLKTELPEAQFSFDFTPVVDLDWDRDPTQSHSYTRSAGFVLEPDEYSYMNVDVFRRREEGHSYNDSTDYIRDVVEDGGDYSGNGFLYGSYIYRLNGGATKCPYEGPEESLFYTRGGKPVQMSNGTLKLENPKIDIINHEVSDVPYDQPAIIKILLSNETEQTFESYVVFKLSLVDVSNPNGAKIFMDGFPLTGNPRNIKLNPGQTIEKTLEVYAGQGYDFEDITLILASDCDILNFMKASFSVHYQPVSCDVKIATPHDKWVMNTLSPKDSVGWYLPVVIDGFDIHYPNFDHIEFQYKLTKQSDDGWVNLCSYYADSTYFNEASGSKQMISAGRIENIAFYGERDPMEQQYDLRAVSFCRYGTSYLTKSSPVLTGIKDTRVPVVFGEPEPANSILGVGDHLKLRFNEPIAGNYLDEDNNFQITGITNETGLSAATALHFDGNSSAVTKAKRDLTDKSFTIDMMIRPTVANNREADMILFETGDGQVIKQLILTKDNRLRMIKKVGNNFLAKSSKVLEPIMAFTRVVCVCEKTGKTRFYLGTENVTDNILGAEAQSEAQDRSAYFSFGSTYDGDMLETRIWTKALTLEEISATANHSLTGYERELLAYYQMSEGKGETVTDHAHGATLYLDGCTWNKQKGYSLRLDGEAVKLNGNMLGRSKTYDMTIMLWFKAETGGTLFNSKDLQLNVPDGYADGNWHHLVLTVSRTYNNAAFFIDGKMVDTYDATQVAGITGTMYLGGDGFKGNIDEFVIFEQALPKSLVELYDDNALTGDEMGLFAYLPFEEQYTNPNGIIEQRFSVNDQRVFKDANGNVVNKVVPILLDNGQWTMDNAPIKSKGVLNKLYFNWAFNNDELMINILNRDYEVNKQSIYVTVRDVEDLNGNPMTSPVTWTAFVDRNSLKWSEKKVQMKVEDNDQSPITNHQLSIVNSSGKRHQFSIESLPSWLSVNTSYGAIDPMGEQTVRLTFDSQIAVGEYSDIIYLTDEDGLSEPLQIEYIVEAIPPYDALDEHKYPYNMSVCAQVKIGEEYDADENDIVYAFYRNECVGSEHVAFDNTSNKAKVYLTIYGNDEMNRKSIRFQLWQASTGKLLDLSTNVNVLFAHGFVYNCGSESPLILTASGSETQAIELSAGWNWISTYMDLTASQGALSACMTANDPWTDGDLIKNTNTRQFSTYDETNDVFVGTLAKLHHSQMYMVNCANGNIMRIAGEMLAEDSMKISVRGDGQWSPMPCLFDRTTSLTEALADYYQKATPGDLVKARNRFATFTEDKRWEGNLTALRPGEGYLFRRLAPGTVEIAFSNRNASAMPKRVTGYGLPVTGDLFTNPKAATNMTMIARLDNGQWTMDNGQLMVYVGDELAAVATPIDSLYFITIQSDQIGELRFEMDGERLAVSGEQISYKADSHYGTIKAPVKLVPVTGNPSTVTAPYKLIEDQHVVIIRNNEKYDVTGKKL